MHKLYAKIVEKSTETEGFTESIGQGSRKNRECFEKEQQSNRCGGNGRMKDERLLAVEAR